MPLKPRPLPDETVNGLRPPLPGFPYFAHADRLPFEPQAQDYSPINAWWLADASFLVYGTAEFSEQAIRHSPLPEQGFRLDWLGTPSDNRGMVLENDTALVVVFRGTRLDKQSPFSAAEIVVINQDDLWTDSQFIPRACRGGGRVHRGFLDAFAQVSGRLDAILRMKRPDQQLWLTGHSLGGALATLAAAHIDSTSIQGLYTYGCPRVGDAKFAAALPGGTYCRFVHRDDWVTTVPPELLGYVHAGTLRAVTGSGERRFWDDFASGSKEFLSVAQSMAKQLRIDTGKLPLKIAGIADHAPIYYATLLWNELIESLHAP
jgi:hypothetical protein